MTLFVKTQKLIQIAVLVAIVNSSFQAAWAQTSTPTPSPSPTPESEELRRAKERNALLEQDKKTAELERDIADAKRKELEANFPKTATALEGKTEVDASVKIESTMMTYRSMAEAANRLVADMRTNVPKVSYIAVYNDRDVKTLLGYMAITQQMRMMNDDYEKILGRNASTNRAESLTAVAAGLAVSRSVLGSFVDLISLFRTDTTIKGTEVNIQESALVSEVFRAIRDDTVYQPQKINLYYPLMFPPNMRAEREFIILGTLEELYVKKNRGAELVTLIEETEKAIKEIKPEIKALGKKATEIDEEISFTYAYIDRLKKINDQLKLPKFVERIEELTGKIDKLSSDKGKIPAQIKDKKENLATLEKTLNELYNLLQPITLPRPIIKALIDAEEKINKSAILGRRYTAVEKIGLLKQEFTSGQKQAIVDEASRALNRQLTANEATDLFTPSPPLTEGEKTALLKIAVYENENNLRLSEEDKAYFFGEDDLRALLGDKFNLNEVNKASLRKLKQESLSRLKSLNTQYDKITAEMVKTEPTSGINALTAYLQAENLYSALGCNSDQACADSYMLQLRVVSAGGNTKVKRNLITNVFTGADISFSGGSIVEYILYDMNGVVKASNTFTVYEKYKNSKNIREESNKNP
jgi:hypothetical protein